MKEQTQRTIALAVVMPLALLTAFLFVRPVGSQQAIGPSAGACFATNGKDVQTTYLDGGGLFYPGPSDTSIEQTDVGFDLLTRTPFRRTGRFVYVPVITK